MTDTIDEIFGPVLFAYTRKMAIEDGCQSLLTGEHAEIARQAGWKYPVYITSGVKELIEQAVASRLNNYNGVLWDIVFMARFGKDLSEDTRIFTVIINGVGRKRDHQFCVQVGPTDFDDPAPALTIMTPIEM